MGGIRLIEALTSHPNRVAGLQVENALQLSTITWGNNLREGSMAPFIPSCPNTFTLLL